MKPFVATGENASEYPGTGLCSVRNLGTQRYYSPQKYHWKMVTALAAAMDQISASADFLLASPE